VCCVEGLAGGRERKKKETQWNKTVPKMKQNEVPYIPTLTIYHNTQTTPPPTPTPQKLWLLHVSSIYVRWKK
jgi:hypothetical protein